MPVDRTGPKLRWTAGEMEAMAVVEDRLLGAHLAGRGTNININLQKQFPERTLEAIKGMRRLPKYKALIERSRVRGVPAAEIPPSTEVVRGASPQMAHVDCPPLSPGSPGTRHDNDAIWTPKTTDGRTDVTQGEDDIVRVVLDIPATASPSCNLRSEDASLPSGDDGGSSPNLFDSTESFMQHRADLREALMVALDCFVGI